MAAPDRNEMMRLFVKSNKDVKIDDKSAFKSVCVTHLMGQRIIWSVIRYLASFRIEMIAKSLPKTV